MDDSDSQPERCTADPVDTTHFGLRIASIFIILAAALLGALTPVFLAKSARKLHRVFFVCKFIGTGVIIATAWMHLLAPAVEALGDECLVPRLGEYDWAFFIGLATVLTMFFAEILATHFGRKVTARHAGNDELYLDAPASPDRKTRADSDIEDGRDRVACEAGAEPVAPHDQGGYPSTPQAHMGHCSAAGTGHEHPDIAGQLTAIIVLEFGVIFHSVFIGLVLATTDNLTILLIVLVFHQFMEGLGLGSRLATTSWPGRRGWLPYLFAVCFAISTPIGTAAGLGAKPSNASDQMLTNGIFDAISAGILMYTGLVELLAHEFMFNPDMKKAGLPTQMLAFGSICFGAGVMALLAKWA
ncbi:zinc-regulated transporter 2 [Plectosphaerella cucumerina]|uniref:Zinc-regulated transporter 2 n=1 Tax=Plectosphaerella cucumerina TaxID=40658 RepID=A0A8K0TDU9_9PEZI|nr:zinc-regulated transporter 2 [Plectosphaerella cucumerina]